MINLETAERRLRERYPDLEPVGQHVYRAVDRFEQRDFAIRYFDLSDDIAHIAPTISEYQEKILSASFFSTDIPTYLRWSQYLYFITSSDKAAETSYRISKKALEENREYARKIVIGEDELQKVLLRDDPVSPIGAIPNDLSTLWIDRLSKNSLSFILDDQLQVPEIVRRISDGERDSALYGFSPQTLHPSERAASLSILANISIDRFRPYPIEKHYEFGLVNLIVGTNGSGKTSLLEAIEFLYCGRSKRTGYVDPATLVSADLKNASERLISTNIPARLRARHLGWYATAELKTVTIENSFAKFNFLNTDAASRFSLTASNEELEHDISRLVLGPDVDRLVDRLRRVREKLLDETKNTDRRLSANLTLSAASKHRIDQLRSVPKISDSLYLDLEAALCQIGWLRMPPDKRNLNRLRDDLTRVASAIAILSDVSPDILHTSQDALEQDRDQLRIATGRGVDIESRLKILAHEKLELSRELAAESAKLDAFRRLLLYAESGYDSLNHRIRELLISTARRETELRGVRFPLDIDIASAVQEMTLQSGLESVKGELQDALSKRDDAKKALSKFESEQTAIALIRQRLIAAARDIMKNTGDANHCPLCKTELIANDLILRMSEDADSSRSSFLAVLQSSLYECEVQARLAERTKQVIHDLATISKAVTSGMTVFDAINVAQTEWLALIEDLAELESAKNALTRAEADGLNAVELAEQRARANIHVELDPSKLLDSRDSVLDAVARINADSLQKETETTRLLQEAETIASQYSIDASRSLIEIISSCKSRLRGLESGMEARAVILECVQPGSGTTAHNLSTALLALQNQLVKVATADMQEARADTETATEAVNLLTLESEAENIRAITDNLRRADRAIESLTTESSADMLTSKILSENAREIARSFENIHAPNEFNIHADGNRLSIVRRETGKVLKALTEMSTGQRAAFVLSVFISLNKTLRTGPPILLFDDPVAHVDDINTVAFLDHLRELAIRGSRQIFFATANTKLAALFEQKFQFLDKTKFQRIFLER